jgi:hypothetical protein
MEILPLEQIKQLYPNEWVLLSIEEDEPIKRPEKGGVLLHSKDYLELCYKASEVAKDYLTTILFTGKTNKNRKWLKSTRL